MTAQVTKHLPLVAGAPDGIKKLRALILECAVDGKLVAQDAQDEPASELIKRIDAARERLVGQASSRTKRAEVKRTPSNKLKHLPAGWVSVTLDRITTIRGGSTPSMARAEYWGGDIPWVSPKDMHSGDIVGSELMITNLALQETSIELVPVGSILLVGRSGILKRKLPAQVTRVACTVNQDIKALTPIAPMESRYVQLLLQGTERRILIEDVKTGTTVQSLVFDKLFSREFGLPPLAEQHRIVAKVDELMALCDRLEADQADAEAAHTRLVQALLDSLTQATDAADFRASWQRLSEHFHTLFTTEASIDALKQTVLQLAVMGKLVPQLVGSHASLEMLGAIAAAKAQLTESGRLRQADESTPVRRVDVPFAFPASWQVARLSDLCEPITSGSTPPSSEMDEREGIPFLKVYNIRDQRIDFDYKRQFVNEAYHLAKMKRSALKPNDVVMNIVGPPLGKTAIIPDDYPAWNCNQAIVFFRLIFPMNPRFVHLFLCEGSFLKGIDLIGTAGQDNISVTKSRNIVMPVPTAEEQSRIVAKVDELMALCDQLKVGLAESRQLHGQLAAALVEQAVA